MTSREPTRRLHRKRVRHFDHPGDVHELTFSCYQRRPLLVEDHIRKLFCGAVDRAIERHDFRLLAFVLMPEHVHLLVQPRRVDSRVSELLFAIKRPSSFRIRQHLQQVNRKERERRVPLLACQQCRRVALLIGLVQQCRSGGTPGATAGLSSSAGRVARGARPAVP